MRPATSSSVLRLGTRGSPLALWQTRWVADALQAHHPRLRTDIVVIKTAGDRNRRDPLSRLGGKGLFVKDIEDALQRQEIDLAVHSMKDMPTVLPPGLRLGAIPCRAEVRDVFVSRDGRRLTEVKEAWRIGTGSLRRQAQLLALHAGLQVQDVRGNVDTRLRKLRQGEVDGLVLAAIGLIRLGLQEAISEYLPVEVMLPAVGQGALALETRIGSWVEALLAPLHDLPTAHAVLAERAFLAYLGGGCMVPIAAFGQCQGEDLHLQGLVSTPRGERMLRQEIHGPASAAETLGQRLAEQLLASGAGDLLPLESRQDARQARDE
jgi:hydroxymethylbilane synthase